MPNNLEIIFRLELASLHGEFIGLKGIKVVEIKWG